ncbi:MAG: hypothetical protein IKX79_04085, partial [Desulfovibrionaceae bacterium]|nr:hypothetical protein [Desulfovibrionaceae bacterium]
QAAGYGASLFIDQKLGAIRDLDGSQVRQMMIENGVPLDEPPGGHWKEIREFKGEPVVSASDMCVLVDKKGRTMR